MEVRGGCQGGLDMKLEDLDDFSRTIVESMEDTTQQEVLDYMEATGESVGEAIEYLNFMTA